MNNEQINEVQMNDEYINVISQRLMYIERDIIQRQVNIREVNLGEGMRNYFYDKRNQPRVEDIDMIDAYNEDIEITIAGERENIEDIITIFTKSQMKTFMTDYILNIEVYHNEDRVKLGYLIVTKLRDLIIKFNKILERCNKRYRFSIKGGSSIHNFFTNIKLNTEAMPRYLPDISVFLHSFISEGSYDKYSDFDTLLYFPSEIIVDNVDNITWLRGNNNDSFTNYLTSEFKFLNILLIQPEILLIMSNLLNFIQLKITEEMRNLRNFGGLLPLKEVITQVNFNKLKDSMIKEELEIEEIQGEGIRYKIDYKNKNNLFIKFTETTELSDSFFNKYTVKIDNSNPYFSQDVVKMRQIKESCISLSNMKIFSKNEDTNEVLSNFLLTRIMLSFEIHEYDGPEQSHNIVEIGKIKENPEIEMGVDNRPYIRNIREYKDFKPVKYKAEILDISEDLDPTKAIKHTKLGITKEYYGKVDPYIYNTSFAGLVYDLLEFFSERKDKKLEKRCKRFSAFIILYVILNLEIADTLNTTLKYKFAQHYETNQASGELVLDEFGYYLFNKILYTYHNWITYNYDENLYAKQNEILTSILNSINVLPQERQVQAIQLVQLIIGNYFNMLQDKLKELGTYNALFMNQEFNSIYYLSEILNDSPTKFKEDIVYTLGKCFENKTFIFERNEPIKSLIRNFIRFYINMDYKTYRIKNQNDPVLQNPFINYNLYKPGNQQTYAAFNIEHKKLISSNIDYFKNISDKIIDYSISELGCKIQNCNEINYERVFAGGYGFKEVVEQVINDLVIDPGLFNIMGDRYVRFINIIVHLYNTSILKSMDVDSIILIDDTGMQGIDVLNEIKFSDTFNKYLFRAALPNIESENREWRILQNVNIQPEFLAEEDNKMLLTDRSLYFKSDIFRIGHHNLPASKNILKGNSVQGIVLSKRIGDINGQDGYCKKNFKNDVLDLIFLSKRELVSFLRQYWISEFVRLSRNFKIIQSLTLEQQYQVDNIYKGYIQQRPESYDVLKNYTITELFNQYLQNNPQHAYQPAIDQYNTQLNNTEVLAQQNINAITDRINLLKVFKNTIQTEEVEIRKEEIDEGIMNRKRNTIIENYNQNGQQDLYIQIYNLINELETEIARAIKVYIDNILIRYPNIEQVDVETINIEEVKNHIIAQDITQLKNDINRRIVDNYIPRLRNQGLLQDLLDDLVVGGRVLQSYINSNVKYLTIVKFRERIDNTLLILKQEILDIKTVKDNLIKDMNEAFYDFVKREIINLPLENLIKYKYMENRDRLLTEEEKNLIQPQIDVIATRNIATREIFGQIERETNYLNTQMAGSGNQRNIVNILRQNQIFFDISDYILDLSTYLVTNYIINEIEFLYINAYIMTQKNKKKLINEIRIVFYAILLYSKYNIQHVGPLSLNQIFIDVNRIILNKIDNARGNHPHVLGGIIYDFTAYNQIENDINDEYIDMITRREGYYVLFENMIKEHIFVEEGNRFMEQRPCYYN